MSEVLMPRLSDTMEEGELSKWLKNVGDQVAKGDTLAEIETDKATMDLEAFESGVLEEQLVSAGTVVAIGTPVAVIGDGSGKKTAGAKAKPKPAADLPPGEESPQGENSPPVEESPQGENSPRVEEPPKAASRNQGSAKPEAEQLPAASSTSAKLRMSPLARKIAKEHGLDLATVTGSGPDGRIVRSDV
ncbi:MAG: biotin/lipoyl-containing protein, partial [Terrimesophilobacter sp.]